MAYNEPGSTNPFAGLFSFFADAPANSASSYPAMQARREMALALMKNSGRKGFPKTVGEGLTAIGDAIGERGTMNQLAAQEAASQQEDMATAAKTIPAGMAPPAGRPVGYAPPEDNGEDAPPVAAITRAITPGGGGQASPAVDQTPPVAQPSAAPSRIYGNDEPSPLDPPSGDDRAKMLATIIGEENNPNAQVGVANVIRNRAVSGKYGGNTPGDVVLAPHQFEPWATTAGRKNMMEGLSDPKQVAQANDAIRQAYGEGGQAPNDPTAGKTMFYSPGAQAALGRPPPSWANGQQGQAIGGTTFYNNPRDLIARSLMQKGGVPTPNPTPGGEQGSPPSLTPAPSPSQAGGGQALAFNGIPNITQAPPLPQVKPMPQQVAQARPQAERVPLPEDELPTDDEKRGWQIRALGLGRRDPALIQQGQALIDYGTSQRTQTYNAKLKDFQDRMVERRAQEAATTAFERGAPQRAEELKRAENENYINQRYGSTAGQQQFLQDMSKGYDATRQVANGLPTIRQAQQALAQAYTGTGANVRLDASKALRAMGVPGDYAPAVATEMLQSRLKAIAGGLIKSTVGTQNISDADREFVEKAYSGTISMEKESLDRLLQIAHDTSVKTINQHNDRLLSVAKDPVRDAGTRSQYRIAMPYSNKAVSYLKAHPEKAAQFDEVYGQGAATSHAANVLRGAAYGD